jgi:acyl-CoA dehydrogenase family protein 9
MNHSPAVSFLERVYEGILDPAALRFLRSPDRLKAMKEILRKYGELLQEYSPSSIEKQGRIPGEMLKKMGEMGLFGLTIPEALGGLGFDLREYSSIVDETAPMDLSVALVFLAHLSIGVKGIELFGNESQKQKYLKPAASGEMIFSYALTEPKIGSDARHIETRAELAENKNEYILNGVKTYITNANYAKGLTVFAQMDPRRPGFMGAFIVETGWEGVEIGEDMPKMGIKASSTAAIHLKNVRVPVENLLGKPGEGYKIALTVLEYGRLGLGAASAGLMHQAAEQMGQRARSRIQFGVPIQNFPLIQEKIIRARVNAFVMRAMNDFCAGLLEAGARYLAVIETSHGKLFGTTRAWEALYDALQVAGGSGYLATQPYEKRMRDFRVGTVFEGTTEIHSIYPALFALGRLGKRTKGLGPAARWTFFVKEFARTYFGKKWDLQFPDKTMKRALALAQVNARTIRRMLLGGLVLYRKRAGEKQFFLRRVTTLSLYLFGLLAALARISHDLENGQKHQADLDLLAFFIEEAREVREKNRRILDTPKEKMNALAFRRLSAEKK